jgi:hypothetical protein
MELLTECCNRLREPICAQARWLGANRESSLPSRCLHGRAGARRRRGPKSRLAAIPAAGIADCPTTRPGRRPLRPDDRTDSGSGSHSRRAPVCARRKLRLRQPARMPGRARHALGRGRHACRSRQLRTIRARNLGREPRVRLPDSPKTCDRTQLRSTTVALTATVASSLQITVGEATAWPARQWPAHCWPARRNCRQVSADRLGAGATPSCWRMVHTVLA